MEAGQPFNMPELLDKYTFKFKELVHVNTLEEGYGFGEVAIMENSHRTGTVICGEDTLTLCFSKDSYTMYIRTMLMKWVTSMAAVMRSHRIFATVSGGFAKRLACYCKELHVIKG